MDNRFSTIRYRVRRYILQNEKAGEIDPGEVSHIHHQRGRDGNSKHPHTRIIFLVLEAIGGLPIPEGVAGEDFLWTLFLYARFRLSGNPDRQGPEDTRHEAEEERSMH